MHQAAGAWCPTQELTGANGRSPQQQGGVININIEQVGHGIVRGVERQMLLDVDQPGQQGDITQIEHLRAADERRRSSRHDHDPAVLDVDQQIFHDRVRTTIKGRAAAMSMSILLAARRDRE